MYNPVDSLYKKAIEISGVKATINNTDTKILVKEANDSYGIDYKKIISSTPFKQGDYLIVNGGQYLICDIEEQMSQSIYNVGTFRKTLSILLGSTYKPVQGIIDKVKGVYVDGQYLEEVHDNYTFIIPKLGNKVSVNTEIVYDGGVYKTISVDTTKDNLYVITGKNDTIYDPHTYTITLNSNSQTLKETENYQIVATCKDNSVIVESPQLTFVSSDTEIATVDATGIVSCVGIGSVTISVQYNNVSADLVIVVEAKPSEPVISYNGTFKLSITAFKQYMTNTYNATKMIDGVADPNLVINYTWDANTQSLINAKKIIVTKVSDSEFTFKNALVTTSTNCYLTVRDSANGHIITDNQVIVFRGM